MDGVKLGSILTRDGWSARIQDCDKSKKVEATTNKIKHLALVTGQLIVNARNLNLEPPYLAYSVLVNDPDMYNNSHFTWLHICFTSVDAGYLLAHDEERVTVARSQKQEELKEGQKERVANLALDLELELDDIEDLGTININDALRSDKEDRARR